MNQQSKNAILSSSFDRTVLHVRLPHLRFAFGGNA
jgi:hypothetical protein